MGAQQWNRGRDNQTVNPTRGTGATERRPDSALDEAVGLQAAGGGGNAMVQAHMAPSPAGTTVEDGAGFGFELREDGAFVVVSAPPGSERSLGAVIRVGAPGWAEVSVLLPDTGSAGPDVARADRPEAMKSRNRTEKTTPDGVRADGDRRSTRDAVADVGQRSLEFFRNIGQWGADDVSPDDFERGVADQRRRGDNVGQDRGTGQVAAAEPALTGDDVVYDDGKSKGALQAKIDAVFAAYDQIPVSFDLDGVSYTIHVEAKYRNVSANQDWLGVKEIARKETGQWYNYAKPLREGRGSDQTAHSDAFLTAYAGKADADTLSVALEEAIATQSDLQALLREATVDAADIDAALRDTLEGWAQTRLGIDCSGFVWQVINQSGEYDDFAPTYDSAGNTAQQHDDRIGLVNASGLLSNGIDLTGQPEAWRPMDVCGWESHVFLIYDTADVGEGCWRVTLMDSQFGQGPTRHDAYYSNGLWASSLSAVMKPKKRPGRYIGEITTVTRPMNPPTALGES